MILSGRRILVIDDTESIRQFLRISLEAYGATVDVAATAAGGLALCEQNKPHLVVLDLGLPDSEGLRILPRLKRLDKNHDLPVIVLTVRRELAVMEKAKELGADAYITKPCFATHVIEVIQELLGINAATRLSLVVPESNDLVLKN